MCFLFLVEQHDDGVCGCMLSDDNSEVKDDHESIVDGTSYTENDKTKAIKNKKYVHDL